MWAHFRKEKMKQKLVSLFKKESKLCTPWWNLCINNSSSISANFWADFCIDSLADFLCLLYFSLYCSSNYFSTQSLPIATVYYVKLNETVLTLYSEWLRAKLYCTLEVVNLRRSRILSQWQKQIFMSLVLGLLCP